MFRTAVARFSRSARVCGKAGPVGVPQPPAGRLRLSTDITGLEVESEPLQKLQAVYTSTERLLSKLPPTSVYRQATSALTQYRLSAVNKAINEHASALKAKGPEGAVLEDTIKAFEAELNSGIIEEVLKQAKKEEHVAAKMLEWQAHEPLETPTPAGQWDYYDIQHEVGEAGEVKRTKPIS